MKLKKILSYIIGLSLVFGFAPFAQAAFNDVTFSADTVVNLSSQGINLTIVSGGQVVSYVVGTNTITFNLEAGSNFILRSNDRYELTNPSVGTACNSSYSQISVASSVTQTIVVTPLN
jgi:hypothetical protein